MRPHLRPWLIPSALCLLSVDVQAAPSPSKPPSGPLSGLYAALSQSNPLSPHTPAPPPHPAPAVLRPRHAQRHRSRSALATLRNAHAKALSAPQTDAFLNAALIYDYEVGRLYRIDASPRFLTTIALRPGEHLVSKAAGDTVRWVVGETIQGAGESAQSLVMIKPVRGDLRTNLVLTTDQRSYFLDAVSHEEAVYTSIVSWNYPHDLAADLRSVAAPPAASLDHGGAPTAQTVNPDRLNFGYRIEHPHQKHGPNWEPDRVFDDGARTFIQFPENFAATEAPPLFLVGPKDQAELVNYHVSRRYYIVDRLIEKAELRLGQNPQTIVKITRAGAPG